MGDDIRRGMVYGQDFGEYAYLGPKRALIKAFQIQLLAKYPPQSLWTLPEDALDASDMASLEEIASRRLEQAAMVELESSECLTPEEIVKCRMNAIMYAAMFHPDPQAALKVMAEGEAGE